MLTVTEAPLTVILPALISSDSMRVVLPVDVPTGSIKTVYVPVTGNVVFRFVPVPKQLLLAKVVPSGLRIPNQLQFANVELFTPRFTF
jgi:hypothetical protein